MPCCVHALRCRFAALAAVLASASRRRRPKPSLTNGRASRRRQLSELLKAFTVDLLATTTALLMLDFQRKQNCAPNPRCVASLPKAQKLLAAARAKGLTIIHSAYPGGGDILPDVARKESEPLITAILDKFKLTNKDGSKDTGLDQMLKDKKGIKTVIVVGSAAANGAVFFHSNRGILPRIPSDGHPSRWHVREQSLYRSGGRP